MNTSTSTSAVWVSVLHAAQQPFRSFGELADDVRRRLDLLHGTHRNLMLSSPLFYWTVRPNLKILRKLHVAIECNTKGKVLDILLRHLVSNIIRLTDRERDNCQCRIFRCAGCELAAVRNE